MSASRRWGPKIVAGLCVAGALLAVVYHTASNQPSAVPMLLRDHLERGAGKAFTQPPPRAAQSVLREPSPQPKLGERPPADREQIVAYNVLAESGCWLDGTLLGTEVQANAEAWQMVRASIEYRTTGVTWHGKPLPLVPDGWECYGVAVDGLLDDAAATVLAGGIMKPNEQPLVAWAAARSYLRGDSERGRLIVQSLVRSEIADPGLYLTELQQLYGIDNNWSYPMEDGDSNSATSQLLLILDAAGAPREAFAEVLRLLVEEGYTAERRDWLAEAASLAFQTGIATEVREAQPVIGRTIPKDIQVWMSFHALRPLVLASTEDFLDGWRRADGEAMEAAHGKLMGYARMSGRPIPEDKFPAAALRRAAECMGKAPRPARLEMARFVAAAMLFRRDTGAWPRTIEEIVPGYLPSGAIDAASRWGVEELAPIATIVQPNPWSHEFAELVRFHHEAFNRRPTCVDDLVPFAPPGMDLSRFAQCFVTLAGRPAFYRLGPADLCSRSVTAKIHVRRPNPDDPEHRRIEVWEEGLLKRLQSGDEKWRALDVLCFPMVPREDFIRLVRGER